MKLQPVTTELVLKDKVYLALRDAIRQMDIYSDAEPPKLDERRLADNLGVSRTPVREALSRLEQEGLVQLIPRRGAFVVRKSKAEILEMIHVWAALESMAARLATERATDTELEALRELADVAQAPDAASGHIDEYSEKNIRFHQAIIGLAGSELISGLADGLFIHMRSIRARTIGERDRVSRSVIDHSHIVDALCRRDTDLAEQLVRDHTLNLARHVARFVDYLD
ncbi:MAG: GntR family transcriptional regulator [Pseudomonadota bacterium]